MEKNPVYVSLEFTPNPNTLKYSVNKQLMERGTANFTNKDEATARSPLAAKLFEVAGISGVMLGRDFVTVTKTEDGDWDLVHKSSSMIIEKHLTDGLPVLAEGAGSTARTPSAGGEVERKIIEVIDNEIRPAVAMDGGDVTFERFEDGVVYVYLQGACAGCPGATMTLKMGIERRLQEVVPEVREVVSI